MNTRFLLMAQYDGAAVIPLQDVHRDYFAHLKTAEFKNQIATGRIPLPVIKIEDSHKSARFIHLQDLAQWIDEGMRITVAPVVERATPDRQKTNGFVYFAKSGDYVKIGFSTKPKWRTDSFLCGNPYGIELLRVVEGTRETETAFHHRFKEYRHRLEWFRLDGELKAWLESDNAALA